MVALRIDSALRCYDTNTSSFKQLSSGPAPGLALFMWAAVSVQWFGASTTVSLNGVLIASASQSAASVLPVGGVGMILTGGAAASWDNIAVTTACSACVGRM